VPKTACFGNVSAGTYPSITTLQLTQARKLLMQNAAFLLSVPAPPQQRAQFAWIVCAVIEAAKRMREHKYRVTAGSLLRSPALPLAKSSRLLAIILAHELLGWNCRVINAAFVSAASANENPYLLAQAGQWARSGCLDDISGCSLAEIKDSLISAFSAASFPDVQNPAADEPPDPPPRHASSRPQLAVKSGESVTVSHILTTVAGYYGVSKEALLSSCRQRSLAATRHAGMYLARSLTQQGLKQIAWRFHRRDHTTILYAIRKIERRAANDPEFKSEFEHLSRQIRAYARGIAGRPPSGEAELAPSPPRSGAPPFAAASSRLLDPSSLMPLDEQLVNAPFLQQLHPRLSKAASVMDFRVNEFIADMIAQAIKRKADLRPLAPHPFREILACNHLDLPEHLVPHAMFIQHALYNFAALLPTRGNLKERALVIRQIRPGAAAAGGLTVQAHSRSTAMWNIGSQAAC
jgi:hypothetical protein